MKRASLHTVLSIVLIAPGLGLMTFGSIRENLGMIITGVILLILGVLMAAAGASLTIELLGKLRGLTELGPEGAKFSEGNRILVGGVIDSEDADAESYPPIDPKKFLSDLQDILGISEEAAEQAYNAFLSGLSEGEIIIEEEEEKDDKSGSSGKSSRDRNDQEAGSSSC